MSSKIGAFRLLAAIIATVLGGIVVLHYEYSVFKDKETSTKIPVESPSPPSNNLTIDISGSGNTLKIRYLPTAKMANDVDLSGVDQNHEIFVNKDFQLLLDISGVENSVYIDNELKGLIIIDDTGVDNKTIYL